METKVRIGLGTGENDICRNVVVWFVSDGLDRAYAMRVMTEVDIDRARCNGMKHSECGNLEFPVCGFSPELRVKYAYPVRYNDCGIPLRSIVEYVLEQRKALEKKIGSLALMTADRLVCRHVRGIILADRFIPGQDFFLCG